MSNESVEDAQPTEDGSLTLRDPATGELYHNRAGAYTEALANFVEPLDLSQFASTNDQLAFLDVCFGLGYNTFCLLNELAKLELKAESIKIVAIEKFQKPLLYVSRVLSDPRFHHLQKQILSQAPRLAVGEFGSSEFSLQCRQGPVQVIFEIRQGDLREAVPQMVAHHSGIFDGIFHDPFSPRRAPELWTIDLFECYKQLLCQPNGKVVTYSSASAIRGAFRQCGLIVRRTPAVGGKSGGTLAILSSANNAEEQGLPLFEEEMAKLAGRAGVPYRDEQFCKTPREVLKAREAEQRLLFPY